MSAQPHTMLPAQGDVLLRTGQIFSRHSADEVGRTLGRAAAAPADNQLKPAQGIILGLALGATLWALIGTAIWNLLLSH